MMKTVSKNRSTTLEWLGNDLIPVGTRRVTVALARWSAKGTTWGTTGRTSTTSTGASWGGEAWRGEISRRRDGGVSPTSDISSCTARSTTQAHSIEAGVRSGVSWTHLSSGVSIVFPIPSMTLVNNGRQIGLRVRHSEGCVGTVVESRWPRLATYTRENFDPSRLLNSDRVPQYTPITLSHQNDGGDYHSR